MKRPILTLLTVALICYSAYPQRLLKTLTGHQNVIVSLNFSTNGAMLVSGSWDKTIRIWNPVNGITTRIIETGKNVLFSTAVSKDAKSIVCGNWTPAVTIYNAATGDVSKTFKAHSFKTNDVGYSPDGKTLVTTGVDTVKLWDATTYMMKLAITGFSGDVTKAVFSNDSRNLATATYDGWICLWDATSGVPIHKIKAHLSNIPNIVFSADGKMLISIGEDGLIQVWDAANLEPVTALKGWVNGANGFDFSSDGKTLAIAAKDNNVYLVDLGENKVIATLKGHTKTVTCVKFSPSGEILATAGDDGNILLWDLSDLKYTKCLEEKLLPFAELKKEKDEFETTEQYNKRLGEYEVKRAEFKKECIKEDAFLKMEQQAIKDASPLASYRYVTLKIQQISLYNADKQTYDVTVDGITTVLKMPLQEAKSFKGVWQTATVKGIQRVNPTTGKMENINMQVVHPLTNVAYMTGVQVLPSTDKYLREFLDKNPIPW